MVACSVRSEEKLALKPAANERYFVCRSLGRPTAALLFLNLLYVSTFILLSVTSLSLKTLSVIGTLISSSSVTCMLGSFRVSVIQRTLTWTTGSLTCVRDHFYACVQYTHGSWAGTPTASQHNLFDSEILVLLTGFELGSLML